MIENKSDLAVERSERYFTSGLNCAESVLLAVTQHFGLHTPGVSRVATAFGGGMAGTQGSCGAMTGGLMAISLLLGRDDATGDRTKADQTGKQFVHWFGKTAGHHDCRSITKVDFSDPEQRAAFRTPDGGHKSICVPLVKDCVKYLCEEIQITSKV